MRPSPIGRLPHVRPTDLRRQFFSTLRDPRVRLRVQVGLAVALAAGLIASMVLLSGILRSLDPLLGDLLYQPPTPSGKVVVIAIDQKSLDDIGPWPWPYGVHTRLLGQLGSAPRVIAFDVLLSEAAPDDPGFAAAIRQNGSVLLSTVGVEAAAFPRRAGSFPQFDVLLLPTPDLRDAAAGIGHRMVAADSDHVVRRVPLAIEAAGKRYPALGLLAAQFDLQPSAINYDLAQRTVTLGPAALSTDENGQALVNFINPSVGLPVYSYTDVLRGAIPPSTFAGKIVLVGGTATSEPETYATPLRGNDTHDVMIQASLADMLVSRPPHLLVEQGPLDQIAAVLFIALLAGWTLPHLRPLTATVLTFIYLLGFLLLAFEAFNRGLIVRILYPTLALALTFAGIAVFRYFSEERRRQDLTSLFRRYLPAESVGRVVEAIDRGELPLTGARRSVTVLYADLRGFVTLSEGLAPEAVLELVNNYLELMLRAIHAENGTVSKPMGDALVAIWNAPLDQPDHAPRALRAALNIRRNILKFQKNRTQEQGISFGLGMASGWGVLGSIYALGRPEYTLVGETVNVAQRISAFAGNNQILADAATIEGAPPEVQLRELPPVRIRGRKEPLPIWEIKDTVEINAGEEEELEEA